MSFTLILQQGTTNVPPITLEIILVFVITVGVFISFATEIVPVDVTAIITMFTLMVLEPWTQISPTEGVSGFSNEATLTVLAMFILSAGMSQTGAIQKLGSWLVSFAGPDERKQLAVTIAVGGLPSGFLNNTPIVAMLMPAISDLAREGGSSPSKLLIPLSYASMVGGMLTLIGSSTNLVASNVSRRLIGHPFSMFEFTQLGVIVFITGAVYLLIAGQQLLPERVKPEESILEEYDMGVYLTEVIVDENSPLLSQRAQQAFEGTDVDILQIVRDDDQFVEPSSDEPIRAGDVLLIRTGLDTLRTLLDSEGISLASSGAVTEDHLVAQKQRTLVELVIPSGSAAIGELVENTALDQRSDIRVLAIRRGAEVVHQRMNQLPLEAGDTLLIQATEDTLNRLATHPDFVVVREVSDPDYREEKIPLAVAIISGVVALAALGILNILVAAFGGVVAMVLTGVLTPDELYDTVDWDVIFLIAGLIPLGIAFEETGAAELLGALVATSAAVLPVIGVLWLFYVMTALFTAFISNTGSVILMLPIGIQVANELNANVFAFVLAVTFAASADFMTPVGYQTNLLVYGPGGYKFTDYFRVGAPLQILLSITTVLGIVVFWGI